jgi:choline dehydrogenase-like flavoprotein
MNERYDVIIIGSGAGGGTLAHTIADSGKSILLLERGDSLPRDTANWDPQPVSSTKAAYNLTVHNTASGAYSLMVMTVVAIIFLPFVLAYQTWTYYVFRRRVSKQEFQPERQGNAPLGLPAATPDGPGPPAVPGGGHTN